MGNGNICYKQKITDKDFDVEKISGEKNNNNNNKSSLKINNNNNNNNSKTNNSNCDSILSYKNHNFRIKKIDPFLYHYQDQDSKKIKKQENKNQENQENQENKNQENQNQENQNQENQNQENPKQENQTKNNLGNTTTKSSKATTEPNFYIYAIKFIEELNNARKNLLKFSEKLLNFSQNFEIIQEKLSKIKQEDIKEILKRTKEDFKEASDFFKNLFEENNKIELNELILLDEIKLKMPSNNKELVGKEYSKKFRTILEKKFSKKYKIFEIKCDIFLKDLDILFLLFITNKTKKWDFLFKNDRKYIGIDYKEHSKDTILFSLVLVNDCEF